MRIFVQEGQYQLSSVVFLLGVGITMSFFAALLTICLIFYFEIRNVIYSFASYITI